MKCIKSPQKLSIEIRDWFFDRGMKTSLSISNYSKINQSQIYRNIFSPPRRISKTLIKLCEITCIDMHESRADPRMSEPLMDALSSIWDGTEEHAKHLAAIIHAVRRATRQ